MKAKMCLTWSTLFICLYTILQALYLHHGPQGDYVTIFFGLFYGQTNILLYQGLILSSLILFFFSLITRFRMMALLGFILWLIGCSIHLENVTGFDHNLILPTQFFFISVLTLFFEDKEQKDWIYQLQLFFLSLHYFGAGITKLYESGPGWVDGTTLQMSLYAWSSPIHPLTSTILENHHLAQFLQGAILLLELIFPITLLRKKALNYIIAITTITFHLFNEILFHYGFWPNIVFLSVSLVLLPILNKTQAKTFP